MAVGLAEPETLPAIDGISVGVGAAGIRKKDRADVAVLLCEPGTRAAGVFTRNRFQAAPVTVARQHLAEQPSTRALVVNSGNANAGTGEPGVHEARAVCRALAELQCIEANQVLPFSTGVIGQPLPGDRIVDVLPAVLETSTPHGWLAAARAIMTTDTVAKGASRQIEVEGGTVTVTGIAKGSGMIHPDMATMLAFVATDAGIPDSELQQCLDQAVARSFNRITVDGDTSTNDACVLLATGKGPSITGSDLERFRDTVADLCLDLAQAVVRDAEGATKFVEIRVTGAGNDRDAHQVALAVAHSPLVKTALFASDANWGRILAAVGRAPVETLDVSKVGLSINDCPVLRGGEPDPEYSESRGTAAMAPEDIVIAVDLGLGGGTSSIWTCDLSHDYVRINAEYRT